MVPTPPVAEERDVPVAHSCPFCHTAMQAGVIIDRISGSNTRPIWIPEPAVESWFGGLREPLGPEVLVSTERCPDCGFLASFGNPRLADGRTGGPADGGDTVERADPPTDSR